MTDAPKPPPKYKRPDHWIKMCAYRLGDPWTQADLDVVRRHWKCSRTEAIRRCLRLVAHEILGGRRVLPVDRPPADP